MSQMINVNLASLEYLTTMWEMFIQGSWICLQLTLKLHKIFSRLFGEKGLDFIKAVALMSDMQV